MILLISRKVREVREVRETPSYRQDSESKEARVDSLNYGDRNNDTSHPYP